MPTWLPPPFPQAPGRQGYREPMGFPVLQAPVQGPPLSRLEYTAVPKGRTLPFLFTDAELTQFIAWFENELLFGSLPYDWRERGIATNPVRQFRIVEEPVPVPFGVYWLVALAVIKLP